MAQKKKSGKSAKGGRPAVLSLGKKVAKAPVKGKKIGVDPRSGRTIHRRLNTSGKNKRTTYKSRTRKGYKNY